jgi:hypothetical protein
VSTPDLSGAADAAKTKLDKAAKAVSALPTPAVGDLADLNADVRGAAKDYRDPAGAVQQDKFADKVKSGPSLGSSNLGDSVKSGLKKAQKKATKAVSGVPTRAVGDVADLNADVRNDATNYRDPAIAVPQDKVSGADATTGSKSSSLSEKIKDVARDNASNGVPKFTSILPTPAVGDLADLNADVLNDATNYRDPAIAVPQDKVSDAVSGSGSVNTPDLSTAADAAKSKLDKAAKAVSALPTLLLVIWQT